jgi:hypothetical protein
LKTALDVLAAGEPNAEQQCVGHRMFFCTASLARDNGNQHSFTGWAAHVGLKV